jgi:hypothetical protein
MDNYDEMMVQLFMEEQNAEVVRRQHQQLIMTSMLRVRRPFFIVPRHGGSKPGKRRNINRHRQAGAMLLDADYFNDDATHSPKEFQHRFRMNKELFLKIVYGVREYDNYFMAKQDCKIAVCPLWDTRKRHAVLTAPSSVATTATCPGCLSCRILCHVCIGRNLSCG